MQRVHIWVASAMVTNDYLKPIIVKFFYMYIND